MKELAALAYRDTSSESRDFWKNEMAQAIREIEGMYADKLDTMKTEMESNYNLKVSVFLSLPSRSTRVADMRRLRSASSNQLDVPSFRLPTVGSRAFPIAGAKVWNSLPDDITSAPSLSTFRRHLKTYLFRCCYNTL